MNIFDWIEQWRIREIHRIRRPLIEAEIVKFHNVLRGKNSQWFTDNLEKYRILIEGTLLRELWWIQASIGTPLEKHRISPGMLLKENLIWSRNHHMASLFQTNLHLEYENFSALRLFVRSLIKGR